MIDESKECSFCDYTKQDWLVYKKSFGTNTKEFLLTCYDNHPIHYHSPIFGIDELQAKYIVIKEIQRRHPELKIGIYDIKVY